MRQSRATWWALAAIGASSALMPFACADPDTSGGCQTPGDDGFCSSAGSAGVGGLAGASGVGGSGSGGAPMMGTGGGGAGGMGGNGTCNGDEACDPASGSLCVAGACTKAQGACDAKLFVVVDKADEALAAAESRDACFFRALAPALGAVAAETERVAVYAATSARVPGPFTAPAGVRLEGHTADVATPVALEVTAPVPNAPLVTMAPGSALAGFALDGKSTARGVAATSGAVRLEGPVRIAATTFALELTGDAVATVRGGAGTPAVVLTGNVRGIDVGSQAGIDLGGDGEEGGVLVEATGMAAGILIRAGDTAFENKLVGLSAKGNTGTGPNGTGAVEVRQGRKVTITGGVFRQNVRAIGLNGENSSVTESFANVTIAGNTFENPTPTTGTAICGSGFTGETQLALGPGNTFPSGRQTPTNCGELGANQGGACNGGNDVSVIDLAEPFNPLTCSN